MAAACLAAFQPPVPAHAETVIVGRIPTTIARAGPTNLNSGRTIVKLRPVAHPRSPRPGSAMVAIDGLACDSPPGVMYEVYLQARNGRRVLLGVINFYNAAAGDYGSGANDGRPSGSRHFDATAALRKLGGDPSAIVFQPISGVTGPAVRADPRARVRFGSATITAR